MTDNIEKIAVFVDGTNLTKGLKSCYNIERLDIEAFTQHLAQGRPCRGIYYAEAPYVQNRGINNCKNQQAYFKYLRNIKGLIYRKGSYNTNVTPPVEKRTDVHLAVDMVDLCLRNEFDIAFIISGDSDLCPAVDVLIREGKRVIVVYFDNTLRNAYALRKHANGYFINITQSVAQRFIWNPPAPTTP